MATVGILIGPLLILMKLLPFVPGHFSGYEYLALALWCFARLMLNRRERAMSKPARVRAQQHPNDD